ncbi:MAG: hypothetical protein ACKKL4_00230 [Patescibacteria group bacterium]
MKYAPKITIYSMLVLGGTIPHLAYGYRIDNVYSLFILLDYLIVLAVQIAFALAVVAFFYGLALYIFKSGNHSANAQGIRLMLWGVVALFVMVSIWGIVIILQDSFGVDNRDTPRYPQLHIRGR